MKKLIYLVCTLILTACATTTKMDSTQAKEDTAPIAEASAAIDNGVLDRTKPPLPGPAPEIQLGTYESFTLENGMKVFVVENHKLPRVAFSLLLDIDPILEGDKAGYISTAGDLLSRGTTSRSKAELDEEVDFIGASLSSSAGGVFGSSLTKHQDKLLELMSDVLLNPSFPQSELDKIKKETISGLQANKEDANAIAQNVRGVLRYGKDHPYGELITEKTVVNISLDDCKKYYQTYFRPNIAYMGIVGDINKAEAEVLVKRYFSTWKSGEVPKHNYESPKAPAKTVVAMVDRPQSVQSIVNITYPIMLKPGEPDVIKARVMNTILGGGFSSNLMQNLREKHAYTYGARSSVSNDRLVGNFNAAASVRNEVTDSSIVQFLHELNRIRAEDVSEEQLQSIKNYITGGFARSLESPQTIANFAINTERYGLPKDYYPNYLKNIQAVTVADVKAMATKYVKPENAHILVVGKASEVADKLAQFGEVQNYDIEGEHYTPSTAADLPADLTAQKVIDQYISALGGKEALMKVQDFTTVSTASMMGQEMKVTSISKVPNKVYMDINAGGMEVMKQVFDGNTLKAYQMGQAMPIPEKEAKEAAITSYLFGELKYDELGVTSELTGLEKVEGKDCYVVEITLPTGSKASQYYDKESGLKVKESKIIETPQGEFAQSFVFDDYKSVSGVMFPHKMAMSSGPQNINMEVTSLEVNTGVSDDQFIVD